MSIGLTSVYVHFPWCARKCPYCDFTTYPKEPELVPSEAYADAVLRELALRTPDLGGRTLHSVFFGGGTPSLWGAAALGRVLEGVLSSFERAVSEVEVTAECNPNSLDRNKARALRSVGVNRLSIGVQSLRDQHLAFLGRLHNSAEAREVLSAAVREVPRVSADLMFGLPGQSVDELTEDIAAIIDIGVRHVSAYALTIEPQTPFGTLHKKGLLKTASDDLVADLFDAAAERFAQSGFTHYEVSNYAQPSEQSTHNEHYWRGGAYVGLGVAAVGCLEAGSGAARRWRNRPDPDGYLKATSLSDMEESEEHLGPDALNREALMLGLRTAAGVDLGATQKRSGRPVTQGREEAVERALERGDLIRANSHLRVPPSRWLKLDAIVRDLF